MDGEALQAKCIAEPTDATAKLVYADWCDENGQPLAAIGLRWMARHGRHPSRNDYRRNWQWYTHGMDPILLCNRYQRRMPHAACWLPEIVGRELATRYLRTSRDWLVMAKRVGWAVQRIRQLVD